MGELVDHHRSGAVLDEPPTAHRRPGEDDAAAIPGLTEAPLPPLEVHAPLERRRLLPHPVARIDEDRLEPVEELVLEAQGHDSRLPGDREADIVVDRLPATTLEPLLGEKNRDPLAIPPRGFAFEPGCLAADAGKRLFPGIGKGALTDRPAPAGPQPGEDHGSPRWITDCRERPACQPTASSGGTPVRRAATADRRRA
jgi:hypothetical protein